VLLGARLAKAAHFAWKEECIAKQAAETSENPFPEAGCRTGAQSSPSSDASPAGQNQIEGTKGVVGSVRSKGRGGGERVLLR